MISLIVARSRNNVIGNENGIPWMIKGEQSQFKELTTGNAVVMGRKTYEDIGRPLPGRFNIVVSNTKFFEGINLRTCGCLEKAIDLAYRTGFHNIYVIGGRRLYEEAVPLVDKMFITDIDMEVPVIPDTVFFPELDYGKFVEMVSDPVDSINTITGKKVSYTRKLYTRIQEKKDPVVHKYITVSTDEKAQENFDGDMADFAAHKLSLWKTAAMPDARIISIESNTWAEEVHPKENNSSTWYKRHWLELSVYLGN